ncbi:hypothetical protein KXV97_006866, partial [Aspergillus fumigatus]
ISRKDAEEEDAPLYRAPGGTIFVWREPLDSLQIMGKWHLQCAWREAVAVEIDPIDAMAGVVN